MICEEMRRDAALLTLLLTIIIACIQLETGAAQMEMPSVHHSEDLAGVKPPSMQQRKLAQDLYNMYLPPSPPPLPSSRFGDPPPTPPPQECDNFGLQADCANCNAQCFDITCPGKTGPNCAFSGPCCFNPTIPNSCSDSVRS
eukprot:jgi/Botrbrau1/2601/Bobra.145_1s0026.1